MFETTVVHARAADRRFGLFSISLAVHTAAIIAVIAASVASTRLPQEAPRQMMPVIFATPPPALGNSAQPQRPAAHPQQPAQTRVSAPHVQTAPANIPESIPAATQPSASVEASSGGDTQTGSGSEGVPWGTPGGVGTEAPPVPDAAGPLTAGVGGVTSPIVMQRVEPVYPRIAIIGHMSGSVVLQCIIDKSGHIRDVRVVSSSFGAFEQPAIDAVQQWVFSPGTLNGQPVDVIFELTVRFQLR